MGKCTKCGCNFVGTPENPTPDQLCRYCQMAELKQQLSSAQADINRKETALYCVEHYFNSPMNPEHYAMVKALINRALTPAQPAEVSPVTKVENAQYNECGYCGQPVASPALFCCLEHEEGRSLE